MTLSQYEGALSTAAQFRISSGSLACIMCWELTEQELTGHSLPPLWSRWTNQFWFISMHHVLGTDWAGTYRTQFAATVEPVDEQLELVMLTMGTGKLSAVYCVQICKGNLNITGESFLWWTRANITRQCKLYVITSCDISAADLM
jgi:hypothetical protein